MEKEITTMETLSVQVGELKEAVKQIDSNLETKKKEMKKMVLTNEQGEEMAEKSEKKAEMSRFFKALAQGDKKTLKAMDSERAKTLNEGTGSAGGYLVPIEFESGVIRYMEKYSQLRQMFNVTQMSSNVKKLNSLDTDPVVRVEGELDTISASSLVFGEPVLTAKKYITYVPYSTELEEDASETDLEALIIERVARAISMKEQDQFINGVTAGSQGFLVVSGTETLDLISGTGFSDVTWEDLAAMDATLGEVDEVDAMEAKYIMSRSIYNVLRTKKTSGSGEFLLPMAPTDQNRPMAWGKEIVIVNQMPKLADSDSGTKFVSYFNGKLHAWIGDRLGLRVKLLEEATLGSVNLGEDDAMALRVRKRTAFTTALQSGIINLATN